VLYPPSFISIPDSEEAKKGHKIEFSCKAKGNPIPDIVWYRNNQAIIPDNHYNLKTKQDEKKNQCDSYFTVEECDLKVEASNKAGQVTHNFGVTG
jgi:hypothetical protein